jgi:hypothetical protein
VVYDKHASRSKNAKLNIALRKERVEANARAKKGKSMGDRKKGKEKKKKKEEGGIAVIQIKRFRRS